MGLCTGILTENTPTVLGLLPYQAEDEGLGQAQLVVGHSLRICTERFLPNEGDLGREAGGFTVDTTLPSGLVTLNCITLGRMGYHELEVTLDQTQSLLRARLVLSHKVTPHPRT